MLQVLCALYPRAPIYTLLYDRDATGGVFDGRVIKTSFLQNLPFSKKHHRIFPLLMPLAIEQFDFSDYDLVLSVSASFAKGIITKPSTKHICYCLTPPRFLWDNSQKFVEEFGYPKLVKKFLPPFITYLRIWDKEASLRVNEFWSISSFIEDRVRKYYSRPSQVVYPPVNVAKFNISKQIGDYFFMAGRLVSYKRFDLAIKAFNQNGLPLKIVGIGPELNKLKKLANKNVEFLGLVSDEKLSKLYSNAQACIFPQEEDFGIVPLESMASGRPVIAYKAGGALETIINGQTGMFFDEQNSVSLQAAIEKFNNLDFKPEDCRNQAEKFDIRIFRDKIFNLIRKTEIGSNKI
ncbi:MAG: Glycosyl transferase group 1 [Candidatus Yanofskybacteria bacterium GW2011_GWA1_41_6]|uniref:Glycosyl transferase group 1 n=1 Tax=Candidatus Yanofskybacteria bacterium GW2011_GWA1_41_6 TaxID=1619020 RepID=A0A0G0WPF2_9BACT|nr:MAG: Glycosyl transferase group 1 [Candidatus Yanofskybacteria bacterium GW2011_GWA1_41_6]